MLMGDEYGHTRYGNNNSYGHDNSLNNFQWGQVCVFLIFFSSTLSLSLSPLCLHVRWNWNFMRQLKDKKDNLFRFFSEMIKFRQSHHIFARENFIGKVKSVFSLFEFICFPWINILQLSLVFWISSARAFLVDAAGLRNLVYSINMWCTFCMLWVLVHICLFLLLLAILTLPDWLCTLFQLKCWCSLLVKFCLMWSKIIMIPANPRLVMYEFT